VSYLLSRAYRKGSYLDDDDETSGRMKPQEWENFMNKHDPYRNNTHRLNFIKLNAQKNFSEEFTLKTPSRVPNLLTERKIHDVAERRLQLEES
jgi:hypothetical protein